MSRNNCVNRTHKALGKNPQYPSAEGPINATNNTVAQFPLFQRIQISPSTGSLAGAEDGEGNHAGTHFTDCHHNSNEVGDHLTSFPTHLPESGSDAGAALPVIAQTRLKSSSLTSPPSATPNTFSTFSLNEVRSSPRKQRRQPSLQQQQQQVRQQQHRLRESSLASTPPQSIETAHLTCPSFSATTFDLGERRADINTQGHTQKTADHGTPPNTPRTATSVPILDRESTVRDSPVKGVSPPPVHFSPHTATPTAQRTSPCPQVLTSLARSAPQLAIQRAASRFRPFISVVSSPASIPLTRGVQPPDTASLSSCTPLRTPVALTCSPSGRQTPIPFPSLRFLTYSQNSTYVPEPVPFSPLAGDGDAADSTALVLAAAHNTTTAANTSEEDQRDLLVEKIFHAPQKMGQSSGSCEKTHPPREASNSRSSREEYLDRAHPHSEKKHYAVYTPQQADSLSCGKDARSTGSQQGRHTSSGSPNEKSMQVKPDTCAAAAAGKTASPILPQLSNSADVEDAQWVFQRPPNNQRTFYFKEDNLEFSSQFDSGNLIQVERVGPLQYRMYTAMDCGNSPWQTNNRQWFHFSLRGGSKGVVVSFTFVGMMHSSMFNFDWMPVTAVMPGRPEYARLPGKARVEPLENVPETPGYPLLVHKAVSKDDADSDGDNNDDDNDTDILGGNNNNNNATATTGGVAFSIAVANNKKTGAAGKKNKRSKKKKYLAMNLTFDYKIEVEVPVTNTPPRGRLDVMSIYIASNHPYSYSLLQRNLLTWQEMARKSNATRSRSVQATGKTSSFLPACAQQQQISESLETHCVRTPSNTHLGVGITNDDNCRSKSAVEMPASGIYYHREVLCKTLEDHDVTLLTISDSSRMTMERARLISEKDGIPHSSAHGTTERPFAFVGKRCVVLTARVHPGECPGSHLMHGCIDFLMNRTDPRAAALRHNFVFYIVPMLNPDGVVRGHSRVDASGVDLNRMYRSPSRKRHPAPYSVMALLKTLGDRVALFVDMHAHANKRGTFFYGNSMSGVEQVENLLYAKLVSLNTPYLDFRSCNFSEANMFAVGKSGKGKDSSSRVVVYTEAGVVHGYTIEASHVMADNINPIVPLVNRHGEELEKALPAPLQLAHTPATFGDTGRAMLVALLDLMNINPLSRLTFTPYHSTRGVSMWLQRQLQIETAEILFAQAFKARGKEVQAVSHESGNNLLGLIMRSLTPDELPEKVTIKKARLLPRITYSGVRNFLPMEAAVALLSQTAPTGPPRSLLYTSNNSNSNPNSGSGGHCRRRGGSPVTGSNSGPAVAATAAVSPPVTELPAVIAAKRRPRPNASGTDMSVES